jgi:hypothetical protein
VVQNDHLGSRHRLRADVNIFFEVITGINDTFPFQKNVQNFVTYSDTRYARVPETKICY